MKYLVIVQAAAGCDYSIGCGVEVVTIDADDDVDAMARARALFMGEGDGYEPGFGPWHDSGEHDENHADSVTVARLVDECPVGDWYEELKGMRLGAMRQRRDEAERAEFDRLKAKYEGGNG